MAVINVIELVADSERSWEDAVATAVGEAARTVRGITGVEVVNLTATVDDGRIQSYRANVNVAFVIGARGGGGPERGAERSLETAGIDRT